MNTFLYATTTPMMWTFRIAVLVRVIVSYAAVMAQFTVSALSRTPTADRSKSISDSVVFIGIFVPAVTDWVPGRPPWCPFREINR